MNMRLGTGEPTGFKKTPKKVSDIEVYSAGTEVIGYSTDGTPHTNDKRLHWGYSVAVSIREAKTAFATGEHARVIVHDRYTKEVFADYCRDAASAKS